MSRMDERMADTSVWNDLCLEANHRSPAGYRFWYPKQWGLTPQAGRLFAGPQNVPFSPLVVFSAQIRETSLADLQRRLLDHMEHDADTTILDVTTLREPRPAVLLRTSAYLGDGLRLRRHYVGEILDAGKLSLTFITSDWESIDDRRDYAHLLRAWQRSEVEPVRAAPGYRLLALEGKGLAFEFPEDWVIHMAYDWRVEIRSPVRTSLQPNIAILGGKDSTCATLEQSAATALAEIEGLQGVSRLEKLATRLGGREGVCFRYEAPNVNRRVDNVWVLVPEPKDSAWVHMHLRGLKDVWPSYETAFQHLQQSVRWTG